MADNTTLNPGALGDVIATDDIGGVKYQRVKPAWGDDGAAVDASLANPIPIQPAAAYYLFSTGNSTVAQLAGAGVFTGTIETTLSQPAVSILITCDQACTLTINQFIDASGVFKASTWSYTLAANEGFARSFTVNANYFNLTLTNNSGSLTTTLNVNTYYGTIPTAGAAPAAVSMPVTVASDQSPIPSRITDGTNNQPTLDVVGRAGFMKLTDGTNTAVIDVTGADGESSSTAGVVMNSRQKVLNAAGTWDRQRGNTTSFKASTYTTAQTGAALWTPAAGKAICITSIQIQSYGTTAGTCIVWFGGSADTAYTRGTDAPIFDGEFAPSATNKPGFGMTYATHPRGAADFVLRVTTTNAQSVTVTVWGYEI